MSCGSFLLPELTVKKVYYDTEKITVEFSDTPTNVSVLESFSLTEDETNVSGIFRSYGKTVYFYPENGIQDNYDYLFLIDTACETAEGNSLSQRFVYSFSTRIENIPPEIISINPVNEGECSSTPDYIEIVFSEPVEPKSFEKSLKITPETDYFVEYSQNEDQVKLILNENLKLNKDYKVEISTELMDKSRNRLLKEYNSAFSLTKKYSTPDFSCHVFNEKGYDCECLKGQSVTEVPLDSKIKIEFDTEMTFSSLSSYISVIPSLSFTITKDENNSKWIILSFSSPEWGKTYTVNISNKLNDKYGNSIGDNVFYSLNFDNESFRKPEFIEGYLQTGNWTDSEITENSYKRISSETNYDYLILDGTRYPIDTDEVSALYLVFSSSKESSGINLYSLLDKVSLSFTNSCLSCVIKKAIKIDDFNTQTFPYSTLCSQAVKDSELKLTVIKYELEITNSNNNGIVQLEIDSGIMDSLGNPSNKSYTFKYNK